jgi:hypothetical protein
MTVKVRSGLETFTVKLTVAVLIALGASPTLALEHAHQVWGGWLECDRGFVMRANECVSLEQIEADKFIVSDLPSAGDGAPTTCPSGGCSSAVAPTYYYAYSAPFLGDWSYPYVGGWSHSHRWRDQRSPLRSFANSGFQNTPRHFNAVPDGRAHAGFGSRLFFGGTSRGRGGALGRR